MRPLFRRLFFFSCLAAAAATAAIAQEGAETGPGGDAAEKALLVDVEGAIGPATVKLLDEALEAAAQGSARLVILRIDTPGGLSESMRAMIRDILAAPVPVAGYVAPSGARAASAGTYILYASHLAAMAPGTNLGAATPVQIGGGGLPLPGGDRPAQPDESGPEQEPAGGDGDGERQEDQAPLPDDAMARKMVNDAVAYIRSLAELRGRNGDWAERAVREGASLPAHEAAERQVIDFTAPSVASLLQQADGRRVKLGEQEITLATADLAVERYEAGWLVELLQIITNPNTALILMMVGIYGLIFEFASPGSIGPGIVGAICLLLGLYALNQLPLDYTGFGLMVLGVALMTAEAVTPTFGVLGLGGLVAFAIGAVLLIDTESPQFQLSWWTIAGTTAVSGVLLTLLLGYVWRMHKRPVVTGVAEVVGRRATVLAWDGDRGEVRARGERWQARSAEPLQPGETVVVDAMKGLTLTVSRPARSDQGEG